MRRRREREKEKYSEVGSSLTRDRGDIHGLSLGRVSLRLDLRGEEREEKRSEKRMPN